MTDRWESLDRRDADQEGVRERFTYPADDEGAAFRDPAMVAITFLTALSDREQYLPALFNLTTPESHESWGDFSDAAAALAAIEDWGLGSEPKAAQGAPDVVYASLLSGVVESFQVASDQMIMGAAVITLVWRPEHGGWLVHAMGDYCPPEDVPRTAG